MLEIDLTTVLMNLIITIFFYEITPILLRYVLKKSYTKEDSKKIATINSVIVYIIFTLIHLIVLQDKTIANIAPAFLYGYLAYFILNNNKNDETQKKNNKAEDEQLKSLINNLENEKNSSTNTIEHSETLEVKHTEKEEKQDVSMYWYKTFNYFILPIFALLHITLLFFHNYSSFYSDKLELTVFFINVLAIFVFLFTIGSLYKKDRTTFTSIKITLLLNSILASLYIIGSIETTNLLMQALVFILTISIWFVPNYIYYKKRKHLFINDCFQKEKDNTYCETVECFNHTAVNTIQPPSDIEDTPVLSKAEHKEKNNKNTIIILIIALIIVTITTISLFFYTLNLKQTSEKKIQENEAKIKRLTSDLAWEEQQHSFYCDKYYDIKDKSDFMDNHIVIIADNTYIYHKYDCKYLDTSRFLAFNTENAIGRGYVACKHCIK